MTNTTNQQYGLFRKMIICDICKKKLKTKRRRIKVTYVCSTYDTKGKDSCYMSKVDEDFLIEYIAHHFRIDQEEVTLEFVKNNVDKIVVNDEKRTKEIFYKDNTKTYISPNKISF